MKRLSIGIAAISLTVMGCISSSDLADERGESSEIGTVKSAITQVNAPWHLDRVDQPTLPLNSTYNYTCTGSGVKIYIIGGHINAGHPEFTGRASNAGTTNSSCSDNATEVAGTAGSAWYGVAKQATLIGVGPTTCSGDGTLTYQQLDAFLRYVHDQAVAGNLPAVAVLRGTLLNPPSGIIADFRQLLDDGVSVVLPTEPNGYAYNIDGRLINVAAVSPTDSLLWTPSGVVDLRAPGLDVKTTSASGSGWTTVAGTHVAAGIVAGAAAQYLSLNPTASPFAVKTALQNGGAVLPASGGARIVQTPCP